MKKIIATLSCILLVGCAPKIGPRNVRIDSDSYNRAVNHSIDSQLLLNMVRLRYRDTPTFLQLGVISAAYEFKRNANGGLNFQEGPGHNLRGNLGASIEYNEKPTATYSPLRGENFVNEFLSPIQFHTLSMLNASGWNLDRILRCCVQRINNVRNAPTASGPTPSTMPEYEEFRELARLLKELEKNDSIHIIPQLEAGNSAPDYYIVIDQEIADHSVLNRVWQLLDIDSGIYQIKLSPYHGKKHQRNEVMVQTRSPLSVLYFLSQGVHAPWAAEQMGLVTVTQDNAGGKFDWGNVLDGIMRIHYTCEAPCEAVTVCYRGSYYYINDSDLDSKATFSMLAQLLALQTGTPQIPVLTLPISSN